MNWFWKRRREAEDEIQTHIEERTAELIEGGMSEKEATQQARREFGNVTLFTESSREVWGWTWLDRLVQDVRYAVRNWRQEPVYAVVAVLTLALGIGGITTIFTVVNGVVLRPLPYREADRLVIVPEAYQSVVNGHPYVPPPKDRDWPTRTQFFDGITQVEATQLTMPESETPVVRALKVPPNYFAVIGARPAQGRDFIPDDAVEGDRRVAIITHQFWQDRLGGDPAVIGKTITFSEGSMTVVGVMPERLQAPFFESVLLWLVVPEASATGTHIGRMKAGLTPAEAQREVNIQIKQVEREYPASAGNRQAISVRQLFSADDDQRLVLILFAGVGLILLMATINVANLMLSRMLARSHEIAIRSAIGAGRRRLIRQLLTESLVLALMGGALGFLASVAGVRLLTTGIPQGFSRSQEIYMDWKVMVFAFLITGAVSIGFGLLPAILSTKTELVSALKSDAPQTSGSRRSQRLRRALVSVEIGMATLLLIGSALTARSFWNLINLPLPIDTKNVVALDLQLPPNRYETEVVRTALYEGVIQRLKVSPNIDNAALTDIQPLGGGFRYSLVSSQDGGGNSNGAPSYGALSFGVTSGYFDTLRMTFIIGRAFQDNERAIVINETFAHQYWPRSNPIGKQIKLGRAEDPTPWVTIVGVVKDERILFSHTVMAKLFMPCRQCNFLLVKAATSDAVATIRQGIAAIDSGILVTKTQSMENAFSTNGSIVGARFRTMLFLTFAGAGLLLAFAGVYGVTAYAVSQRRREVGIRIALGATRRAVLQLIMEQAVIPIVGGIAAGLAAAQVLVRTLTSYLYDVTPTDSAAFVFVPMLLAMIALAASFIPARQSTRVDPLITLKYE